MDEEIEGLIVWYRPVTAEHLKKILADEATMQEIDARNHGWAFLHEKAASQELKWEIRNLALERARNFDAYMDFVHDQAIGDDFAIGALFHAETFDQFLTVGMYAKSSRICTKAFTKALELIQTLQDAGEIIYGLEERACTLNGSGNYGMLFEEALKKGIFLSGTIAEASDICEQGLNHIKRNSTAKATTALIIAESLSNSEINFTDKKSLKKQAQLCRGCYRWKNKECAALLAQLNSIVDSNKHQRLSPRLS